MRTAIGHAIRAGELLIEAKELVPHGAWQRWLSEHFRGSERTAQGYMQLARAPKPATVADSGVRAALAALAAPRAPDDAEAPAEEDVEVVDAEPVPEPGPSIVDQLREAHGAEEFERATEELAAEDARQRREFSRAQASSARPGAGSAGPHTTRSRSSPGSPFAASPTGLRLRP